MSVAPGIDPFNGANATGAVMQLVEEGKSDLHADVNSYLETFQIPDTYLGPVTLAHLLTHTAKRELHHTPQRIGLEYSVT